MPTEKPDLAERLFAETFASLNGRPATLEAIREIARAAAGVAANWVNAMRDCAGTGGGDEMIAKLVAEIALEELARLRKEDALIRFNHDGVRRH